MTAPLHLLSHTSPSVLHVALGFAGPAPHPLSISDVNTVTPVQVGLGFGSPSEHRAYLVTMIVWMTLGDRVQGTRILASCTWAFRGDGPGKVSGDGLDSR